MGESSGRSPGLRSAGLAVVVSFLLLAAGVASDAEGTGSPGASPAPAAPDPAATQGSVTFLYSVSNNGYIEPCG